MHQNYSAPNRIVIVCRVEGRHWHWYVIRDDFELGNGTERTAERAYKSGRSLKLEVLSSEAQERKAFA